MHRLRVLHVYPILQDMLIPLTDLKASIELFEKEVEIYPIWLCPFKLAAQPGMLRCPADKEEMCVDVGVYGVPRNPNFQAEATTRCHPCF